MLKLLKRKKQKQKAQVIDLFQESEYTRKFLKENIEKIVKGLSKHLKEAEDSYRELSQNSIDSETPQIDIYFDVKKYDQWKSRFTVVFEDYGIGMNFHDREDFFLKLFASKKEHDIKKIGKYGIGISSIFALDLEELVVESSGRADSGEIESWKLHVKDIDKLPSYKYYDIKERKGTRIKLTKTIPTKDIKNHKAKVREKIAFYCERSRTPIYIEKEFINKQFDLDSMIKLSQNRGELEYVLSIGEEEPFFEIFNNRLKLQSGKSLFSDYKEVSCLISSPYFKHTFSRDSVVNNDTYRHTINEVEKAISGLFVKSLEVIEHYKNTRSSFSNIEMPFIEIKYSDGWVRKIDDSFAVEIFEREIKSLKKNPRIKRFRESLEEIEKKISALKEKQTVYFKRIQEHSREIEKRNRETDAAWGFVNSWLKNTIEKVESKRVRQKGGLTGFFKSNDFYERLKKALPLTSSKYKVINTLGNDFSIPEILDVLKNEGSLYYIFQRNPKLEKLLEEDGKIIFWDSRYNFASSGQKKTIEILASKNNGSLSSDRYVNANSVYSVSLRLKDNEVDKRQNFFLETVKKNLPVKLKAKMGDIYFTNKKNLSYDDQAPVIFRSTSGKINIGEPKKTLKRKLKDIAKNTFYQKPYDVALNLDTKIIQNMISLIHTGHEFSQNMAIHTIIRLIAEKFPVPVVKYTGYNAGSFASVNYQINYRG